jgi:hypothetical protein
MTRTAAQRKGWVVQCTDYTTKPFASRRAAERNKAATEAAGHCQNTHEIVEVTR